MQYATRVQMRRVGFAITWILFLLLGVVENARAQDGDSDTVRVWHAARASLELMGVDLRATVIPPFDTAAIDLSFSSMGAFLGCEYLALRPDDHFQLALGLFVSATPPGGGVLIPSFYAPFTLGGWINLGSSVRLELSMMGAFSYFTLRNDTRDFNSDTLDWGFRQGSFSFGPMIGVSMALPSSGRNEHRIGLSTHMMHYLIREVTYNHHGVLLDVEPETPILESPTLRLTYTLLRL